MSPTKVSWIGRLVDNMADVAKSGWGATMRFALLVVVAGALLVGAIALLRVGADEVAKVFSAAVTNVSGQIVSDRRP